jgi:hypothetical protein
MYQPAFSEYNIVMNRLCSFGLAVLQFREVYRVPHTSPLHEFEFGQLMGQNRLVIYE